MPDAGNFRMQRAAFELRTFQDNLTHFLRRHDAAELPEVGLQSAATNLCMHMKAVDGSPNTGIATYGCNATSTAERFTVQAVQTLAP